MIDFFLEISGSFSCLSEDVNKFLILVLLVAIFCRCFCSETSPLAKVAVTAVLIPKICVCLRSVKD